MQSYQPPAASTVSSSQADLIYSNISITPVQSFHISEYLIGYPVNWSTSSRFTCNLSSLLTPPFINIASQDPLPPVCSSCQALNFPSSGQNFNFSHYLSSALDVPAQPFYLWPKTVLKFHAISLMPLLY